ncbi:MAG: MurR/RpiR family transcriptional regulator [Anaerostipes hadrus]
MNIFQSRGYIIREEEDMRLEELLNQYSDRLSENDLYIWDYVEKHKKQCENMTIEELARKCNVSRTTVLRFTKSCL